MGCTKSSPYVYHGQIIYAAPHLLQSLFPIKTPNVRAALEYCEGEFQVLMARTPAVSRV